MLTCQELLYWACRQSFFSLQPYSDEANGSMKKGPSGSLLHVSKLLLTMITAMEIYANPCVALTTRNNSPCIFKTKASRITKPYSHINFPPLCNIWKDQLYRISRSEFYEWLFGPKKFSGLREKGLRLDGICLLSTRACYGANRQFRTSKRIDNFQLPKWRFCEKWLTAVRGH